ncbi:MAG: FtsW/RodA/SpoVE family cell cycle protein [bacterium]|nr:FtsW/RodA/SpoVE family cell cycle protein [bacterium]
MILRDTFRRFDWILFASVVVLLAMGSMAITSVALSRDVPDWQHIAKHGTYVALALGIIFFGATIDYRALRAWNRVSYVGGILLLLAVLFLGSTIRGTRGWFSFAGMTFQPVEITKIIFLVFLATYFERWARESDRIRHVLLSGLGACVYLALIFLQPDTGSAFLFFSVWFSLLVIIGIRRRHFVALIALCAVFGMIAWVFLLHNYQRERIMTFFEPSRDPLGRGYNTAQAKIAVGGGQFFGRGFGFGSQSQLRFLPEAETDFIFAVIAEEWGFVGATLLLTAWGLCFWRIFITLRRVRDDFALFFLIGALLLFFIEVSVTIGMNIGLVPVTGLTLPFVSYGGSSLLAHAMILAIVQSIIIRNPIVR